MFSRLFLRTAGAAVVASFILSSTGFAESAAGTVPFPLLASFESSLPYRGKHNVQIDANSILIYYHVINECGLLFDAFFSNFDCDDLLISRLALYSDLPIKE